MSDERGALGQIGRRGMLIGAGAVAILAGTGGQPASAAGTDVVRLSALNGSPTATSIASAPVSGLTYRTVSMYDFSPFDPAAERTWGGDGVYSGATRSPMRASVEIPAGALVRSIEYYVSNTSGAAVDGESWLYTPGEGSLALITSGPVPSTAGGITATLVTVPSTVWGPYPQASRLLVGLTTPATGSVQINGARVGFSSGGSMTGLLDTPYRAYDSRVSGGKLLANTTRTITIPSSIIRPGTAGVLATITATAGVASGYFKVFSAAVAEPASSAMNYTTAPIANTVPVSVSAAGQIKIKTSVDVHVIVDVIGTFA